MQFTLIVITIKITGLTERAMVTYAVNTRYAIHNIEIQYVS